MNRNGLANVYDQLTANERFPLIVAALARGDEPERQRLMHSAPTKLFRAPHHFGLAGAFLNLARLHMMQQLGLAADFWMAGALLAREQADTEGRARETVLSRGYLLRVGAVAWQRFCAEHRIDADSVLQLLPGYDALRCAEETAAQAALTQEEANGCLRREGDDEARAVTADDLVAAYEQALAEAGGLWT
jgi:hypothetical protein